jgi:DNA-binding transcriptional LysR family regulator
MSFTLDQLRALDAIERTGSFALAAGEMHRVPSAVSYLVKELEATLGLALFDRSRRRAVFTREGRRVLAHAREVLLKADLLGRAAEEMRDGWEPELKVVVDGALPMAEVMACIRRFGDPLVPTSLRVDIEYQEGVIDRFHGGADLALVLGFDGSDERAGYDCQALPELELLLVAAPSHPLAHGEAGESERGQHAELVVRDSSPRFSEQSKPSFLGSRNVVFLSDFHSKRTGLLAAAGYGWIPQHFVSDDLIRGDLVLLPCEPNRWSYQPQVIRREGVPLGRGGRLFLETLEEELGEALKDVE